MTENTVVKKEYISVRVNANTKKEFSNFCDRVGLRVADSITLFMKATLAARKIPFDITDIEVDRDA
jgi:addiction module RelB/DinJ family antitoxin